MGDEEWWETIHQLETSLNECKKSIQKELNFLPRWIKRILWFFYPFLREEQTMEITKYGVVAISEDEVHVSGFHIDGDVPGSWLPPNAGELIVMWAIERLWKTLSEKRQKVWMKNHD